MARHRKPRRKKTRQIESPNTAKVTREREEPDDISRKTPVWRIGQFDLNGPWGKSIVDLETVWDEIFLKLQNFESMTWGEIEQDRKRNHPVSVDKFIVEARRRLEQLQIDQDELFRFRFTGKQRLWGIRSLNVFTILWWDPDHKISPSPKRHT